MSPRRLRDRFADFLIDVGLFVCLPLAAGFVIIVLCLLVLSGPWR